MPTDAQDASAHEHIRKTKRLEIASEQQAETTLDSANAYLCGLVDNADRYQVGLIARGAPTISEPKGVIDGQRPNLTTDPGC